MRRIAFMSEKGGTSKTTTALNAAAVLAEQGRRVLVIDADPQANASFVLLGGEPAETPTLLEVLDGTEPADEAIVTTRWSGVDLLPAEPGLAEANVRLANELGRERRLRLALEAMGPVPTYDWMIVDTGPARSVLNVNVLNAIDEIIAMVAPGLFSLVGLAQLQAVVEEVQRYLDNQSLRILGLLLSPMERTNVHRDVEGELRSRYGSLVFEATIPRSVKIEEAHSRFQPVTEYAPRSAGSRAFHRFIGELIGDERDGQQADQRPGSGCERIVSTDDETEIEAA